MSGPKMQEVDRQLWWDRKNIVAIKILTSFTGNETRFQYFSSVNAPYFYPPRPQSSRLRVRHLRHSDCKHQVAQVHSNPTIQTRLTPLSGVAFGQNSTLPVLQA